MVIEDHRLAPGRVALFQGREESEELRSPTASNCCTCPLGKERRKVPNVDGARSPPKSRTHPVVARHVQIIDAPGVGEHPANHAGCLGRRVRRTKQRGTPWAWLSRDVAIPILPGAGSPYVTLTQSISVDPGSAHAG